TAVLHTHSRSRDYHPHVHLVVTGGGLNLDSGKWKAKRRYLFNSQNLARVFRAKLLQRLRGLGLSAPPDTPKDWVAHCACVGDGDHALAYLARYLYRGVLSETDMLGIEGDNVRFRYRDARTGELRTRCLPGAPKFRTSPTRIGRSPAKWAFRIKDLRDPYAKEIEISVVSRLGRIGYSNGL
ncbi:MAG: transposase, partial [Zoogloeaceae bacterium]|nr:transposase [Zoogloeaceae bacterium]